MIKIINWALVFLICFSLIGCTKQSENVKPESEIENTSDNSSIDNNSTAEADNSSEEVQYEVHLPELLSIPEDLLGQELQVVLDKLCPGLTEQKVIETAVSEELNQDRNYILVDQNGQQYFLPESVTEEGLVFYVKLATNADETHTVTDIVFVSFFDGSKAKEDGLAAMETMTNRLVQEFGEPDTNSSVSSRYWENANAADALEESQYVKDQWIVSENSSEDGLGIMLQTRLAKAGKMFTLSVQYSLFLP